MLILSVLITFILYKRMRGNLRNSSTIIHIISSKEPALKVLASCDQHR